MLASPGVLGSVGIFTLSSFVASVDVVLLSVSALVWGSVSSGSFFVFVVFLLRVLRFLRDYVVHEKMQS